MHEKIVMTLHLDQQKIKITSAHAEFQKGLSTYASFKVNNQALSDDLVQDTFIKTWSYLVRGGEIVKMKAFLYHVLNGLIIDEYRKKKLSSLDVLMENGFEINDNSNERTIDFLDGKTAVLLIQHLPKAYQKVMRMRYVQDLSLEEMSKISGKSKNTMAVQAHRGLEKLKALYNQETLLV